MFLRELTTTGHGQVKFSNIIKTIQSYQKFASCCIALLLEHENDENDENAINLISKSFTIM